MNDCITVKAVVTKVILDGCRGSYVVARGDDIISSITFSLNAEVWTEIVHPQPGEFVLLSNIVKRKAGWRARKARYFKPCDQQLENCK